MPSTCTQTCFRSDLGEPDPLFDALAERDRLRAAIAKSCDETRLEDFDAGCPRAVLADAEIARLQAYQDETAKVWYRLTETQEQEIADLTVERDRLRAALKPFAEIALTISGAGPGPKEMIDGPDLAITPKQVRAAMAALGIDNE